MRRSMAAAVVAAFGLAGAAGIICPNEAAASTYYGYGGYGYGNGGSGYGGGGSHGSGGSQGSSDSRNYGTLVKENGQSLQDFSPNNNYIDFYIPLQDDEIFGKNYGDHKGGFEADECTQRRGCDGGSLTMFIKYTGVSEGPAVITFDFTDLDLAGFNDPSGFFETVEFSYKNSDGSYTKVAPGDVRIDPISNINRQLLQIVVAEVFTPFTVKLVLNTGGIIKKGMINTPEKLKTWITPAAVPLPPALSLFGTGLAAIGVLRWRRGRAGKAAAAS